MLLKKIPLILVLFWLSNCCWTQTDTSVFDGNSNTPQLNMGDDTSAVVMLTEENILDSNAIHNFYSASDTMDFLSESVAVVLLTPEVIHDGNGNQNIDVRRDLKFRIKLLHQETLSSVQIELATLSGEGIFLIRRIKVDQDQFSSFFETVPGGFFEYSFEGIDPQIPHMVTVLITASDGSEYPVLTKIYFP